MKKENRSDTCETTSEEDRNIVDEPYIAWTLPDAVSKISRGLSTDVLTTLQRRLQLSNSELADILMISARTLDRRKKEQTLPPDESERSYRVVRLTDLAADIFGGMEKATSWFRKSNYALGNETPIALVKTEPGARLVERTLGQIHHGITV